MLFRSQAVLVSSSDVKRQDNRSAKAESDNLQGEDGKHEEQELRAQSSERKVGFRSAIGLYTHESLTRNRLRQDVAVKKINIERNMDIERVLGVRSLDLVRA